MKKPKTITLLLLIGALVLAGCAPLRRTARGVKTTYNVTTDTVKAGVSGARKAYRFTRGTTSTIYRVGEFTFEVVRAPIDWPLLNPNIETVDGLPVKEAIRQGRVKNSPYTVKGKRYYPMSVDEAQTYEETGVASWYGYETRLSRGGHMTANGEAFNPRGLSAAHKYLPLPTNVKVTNLENKRYVIVRVNDRGPFPSTNNPRSGDRIIDLSMGAAKRLGFYEKGTARVKVETISVDT